LANPHSLTAKYLTGELSNPQAEAVESTFSPETRLAEILGAREKTI